MRREVKQVVEVLRFRGFDLEMPESSGLFYPDARTSRVIVNKKPSMQRGWLGSQTKRSESKLEEPRRRG